MNRSKKKFWDILKKLLAKGWNSNTPNKDTPHSVWISGYKRWRKMMDKMNANN